MTGNINLNSLESRISSNEISAKGEIGIMYLLRSAFTTKMRNGG